VLYADTFMYHLHYRSKAIGCATGSRNDRMNGWVVDAIVHAVDDIRRGSVFDRRRDDNFSHPCCKVWGQFAFGLEGASAIKFEDPRLQMMMAAPARRKDARADLRSFHYEQPAPGDVLLWESWLRHEVPVNMSEDERISVSFNYSWK